jgi:hypothetical protein
MIYNANYRFVTGWRVCSPVIRTIAALSLSVVTASASVYSERSGFCVTLHMAILTAAAARDGAVESGNQAEQSGSAGIKMPNLASWPPPLRGENSPRPLAFHEGDWPYNNEAGRHWVEQINAWYDEGLAAGLSQDTFRSFDVGHSSVRLSIYPQLNSVQAVPNFGHNAKFVFPDRVTFGVQSYGTDGMSIIEAHSNAIIRGFYESKSDDVGFQKFYQTFYDFNFLFISPAVGSYSESTDKFSFLSPYYLHAIGMSGSDAALLKPLIYASAAMPPEIKTRALRTGRYVPALLYLFKSALLADIRSPEAHRPAYALPDEAAADWTGPAPFLDRLIQAAHDLSHLPPVCQITVNSLAVEAIEQRDGADRAYAEISRYGVTGTLRKGQELRIVVDLSESWTDGGRRIVEYHASTLCGQATITSANESGSSYEVRIPWMLPGKTHDKRTDILLLVHDGTYYSAPAYLSIRHINELDPIVRNIPAKPDAPGELSRERDD